MAHVEGAADPALAGEHGTNELAPASKAEKDVFKEISADEHVEAEVFCAGSGTKAFHSVEAMPTKILTHLQKTSTTQGRCTVHFDSWSLIY